MSVLIDRRAVRLTEAVPPFDLPGRVAPAVPARSEEPLSPLGNGYLGANSTQLAAALQRRYHGLKIKALYTGGTLEHAVAYDPRTGLAHDARGTHKNASAAFAGYGSTGMRGVTQVENAPPETDPEADAYVARHWAPFENGGGSSPGAFEPDYDLDPGESDALVGGDPAPEDTLVEALVLLEAIWNEKLHPKWPPGSKNAAGKHIGGEWMRVGQRFNKDGHEWEIGNIAGNKIIAHEASGVVDQAETRVFDTKTVGDVTNALPGAVPAAPRVLKSGFQPGTKTVIPDENSLVVDADTHGETHDPAIQPHPLSTLTPEQWQHFGRVDQLYYNTVMEHFGAWEVNGKKPPPIAAQGAQWASKLQKITGQAPPDAVSTFESEVSGLKGHTTGSQLSGVSAFKGLTNDSAKLASAQEKYQRFREYEGDVNALISWDLYNRLGAPDITVIHRAKAAELFKKILQGKQSVLSGLSTAWRTGSWSEPHSFVFAMPVRNVAFFESLLGQGWGAGSGENELANIDRLKVGDRAGYFQDHEVGSGGQSSQAGKVYKWLTDKLNTNSQNGWVVDALKKHFDPNNPFLLDLGKIAANFHLKKAAGEKTYYIPPDDVLASIEEKVAANPGHAAWEAQKKISEWPEDMQPKPGMVIEKGGQQAGTRYLVIQNDALGPGEIQYIPLMTGSADHDVNPEGGGFKSNQAKVVLGDDGKPLFFPLPAPPEDRVWHHDLASLSPSGTAMPIGSMDVGDKVTINDDHWKITKKTGGKVDLQSLTDGSEGTVDSLWQTQKLYPTGVGAPEAAPAFKPEPGKSALYHLKAGDQLVTIEGVNPEDKISFGEHGSVDVRLPNGQVKTVAAIALTDAPTLPKLTAQKGDTFMSAGQKYTVTHVMKDGTVNAKPLGGTVVHFPPDSPGLSTLFRPGDYEPGDKQKLHSLAPGTLVSGSPKKVAPYQVLGTSGTKTHLKNLDTGEVTSVSKNVSYPTLVGKGATASGPEPGGGVPHADWKPGDKVNVEDLQVGDKVNTGGTADYTVTGESTHLSQAGWQLDDGAGMDAWIPKDLSINGLQVTYLGKGEEPTKPPPVSTVTAPGALMDAVEHGDLAPYKWHKGGGGQVYPKISSFKEGEHFQDKNSKLWKVKQEGDNPIVTDGENLYTAPGNLHGKEVEPGSFTPLKDATPEISPPLSKVPAPEGPAPDWTANTDGTLIKHLGLKPGDKFTWTGKPWTVDSVDGPAGAVAAHNDEVAMQKSFGGFAVPDTYWKAPAPEAAPAKPLPSFLEAAAPMTAYSFLSNELGQRADGSIVYKAAGGDHWLDVGGNQVTVAPSEVLTFLAKPGLPDKIGPPGESMNIHEIPVGQSFYAAGEQPFVMLGHGDGGSTAINLKTFNIIHTPTYQGQQNVFLGTWKADGPPAPTVPQDSALHSMLTDFAAGHTGQYGAWSIKDTTHGGKGLYFGELPVAWKSKAGEHYVNNAPAETWPGSTQPQEVVDQLQQDHPGYHAVSTQVLAAIPIEDGTPGEVPSTSVQTGATVPGPGAALATALVKGHHMKIKEGGAEYEVLETPTPGVHSVKLQTVKGGKVYDWKHGPNKEVVVTKAPPTAPPTAPSGVPPMVPNTKSLTELGLKPGDYFKEGGTTYQVVSTGQFVKAKDLSTGVPTTLHNDFVPEKAAPQEPEPPSLPTAPSGPIPTPAAGSPMADVLNVGDKYKFTGESDHEFVVTGKGPDGIKIKTLLPDGQYGGETTLSPDATFGSPPTITYKAPPSAVTDATGVSSGPLTQAQMPISPYLWHKSGSKTYPGIATLKPGEQFTDKSGKKYTVYKHNAKHLEDPVATTTVQGPDGGMVDIPQTFVNAKGKTIPTHVNKLSTDVSAFTPPPEPDSVAQTAQDTANEFLIGAGHLPTMIQKLHSEAAANVASNQYPATWTPAVKWAQAYNDAYVSTYGEGPADLDMANALFDSIKATFKADSATTDAKTAANALLHGDVVKQGEWHTELKGPPEHATMVLSHGTGDDALPVAYSDENGHIHVTPTQFKPSIDTAVQYLKDNEPDHIVAASHQDLNKEIEATTATPKTWADLKVGDLVDIGGSNVEVPFKITGDSGDHWQVTSVNTGATSKVLKTATGPMKITGHEPQAKSWADLRVGDHIKTSGGSLFKVTGQKNDAWEIESLKDGSKTTIPLDSTLGVEVVGHEHIAELPDAVDGKHSKAMRIADKWMKKQGMPPEQIAQIHQNVATFYASNPQFSLGDAYATSIGDKQSFGGLPKTANPWEGADSLQQTINNATEPQMLGVSDLGVGDVFQNDIGGKFKITGKNPTTGAMAFEKLSGAGVGKGMLTLSSTAKYKLVSKGEPFTPPTAENTAIPVPQDSAHENAIGVADQALLKVAPTAKTVNWIHQQAPLEKEQSPGFSWGEAYAAATHKALPDQTPDQLVSLTDTIDATKGPLPGDTKLPQPMSGTGTGIPDYTDFTNGGTELSITGSAGGTTGAQKAVDQQGKPWLIKSYASHPEAQDRVATELLANAVYRAMGHNAADAGILKTPDGKTKLAYPLKDGDIKHWSGTDEAKMKALGNGLMTDALVGNWDFAGLEDDNVLWNGDDPTRIDQGGTFMYRAQGKPKEFGPVPSEVKSLMTGGGQGVNGVSVSEAGLRAQAWSIAKTMTPEKIDQLVDAAPFADQSMKDKIRTNLKARVQWMSEFADGQHSDMLDGVKLAPNPGPAIPNPPATLPPKGGDQQKAFNAAFDWMSEKGLSMDMITKIDQQATAEHDNNGVDWPTAYTNAATDNISGASIDDAPAGIGNPAEIFAPIEKALGTGPSQKQPGPGDEVTPAQMKVGDVFHGDAGPLLKVTAKDATGTSYSYMDGMAAGKLAPDGTSTFTLATPPAPTVSTDTPAWVAKYQVGHHVSYATNSGEKTGTITKDTSMSATQHSYLMDNGDKVDESSIGGKVAKPSPVPTGPLPIDEMPIKPYLWHKSSTKSYPSLATVDPHEHFTDKSGNEYLVISNIGGVTMAQPVIDGVPTGAAIAVPQTFVNKKGKVQPTHVSTNW